MQEAIFRGKLDITEADVGPARRGTIEGGGQRGRQLKIWGRPIIEIDPGLAADAASRGRAVVEGVDLEVLLVGRLGVVGHIGRPGQCGTRQAKHCNGKDCPFARHRKWEHRCRRPLI